MTLVGKWNEHKYIELSDDFQSIVLKDDGQNYAETPDEIKRLKVVNQLIESLVFIAQSGHYIDFNAVARACPNVMIITDTNSAVPSEYYIKQYRY